MKNEKLTHTAPEVQIDDIGQADTVLISVHDEEYNLDERAVKREDRKDW